MMQHPVQWFVLKTLFEFGFCNSSALGSLDKHFNLPTSYTDGFYVNSNGLQYSSLVPMLEIEAANRINWNFVTYLPIMTKPFKARSHRAYYAA